ncbi:MAG: formate/nitrite transporter family protein [Nitrosomonadaceae bacterium]|nr:formate/nitrite transporter family protein [Nitrosomonadaceae bacterium]
MSSPPVTNPAAPAPAVPQLVANADQVLPPMMLKDIVTDAVTKDKFTNARIILSGFLCTPFLAYAVALSVSLVLAGWSLAAAGLIFPVGFVMMVFLGLEMATGSFSVMPMGVFAGLVKWSGLARNWIFTLFGNLLGGIFFAFLLWFALTKGASIEPSGLLVKLAKIAEAKASYENFGINGWFAAVGMGVLCNWLVSLGPMFAKASRSVPGKIMLMWLPIATFFALGFEHAIVNMFVFPIGILSGADVTISQWWWWNQIPVTLGNIVGAMLFNSVLWYTIHKPKTA